MDVEHRKPPAMLASDLERDDALLRLHTAFAEGRLTGPELDERMDAVLAARTRPELDRLLADLPLRAQAPAPEPAPEPFQVGGRWQLAYKNEVRRGGRWQVPPRFTVAVYKGEGIIDLRTAEFEGPVTTIRALAYKSRIEILVPPGVRLDLGGVGVSGEVPGDASPHAPVLRVKGLAYKGAIEARSAR